MSRFSGFWASYRTYDRFSAIWADFGHLDRFGRFRADFDRFRPISSFRRGLGENPGMRVLLTGGSGFIGRRLHRALEREGHAAYEVAGDVLSPDWVTDVRRVAARAVFDRAVHLAAHKYATLAEECPADVAELNVRGTANVVEAAGCRVILASTCKAADPCTVYGASKLIAERIVLNAGGVVIRLVNVLGSSGSVLQIWGANREGPLPVTDCRRMWVSDATAVELLLRALTLEPGRYAPDVPSPAPVKELAAAYFPNRETVHIPLRRGDRPVERLVGEYETAIPAGDGLVRILDCWEPIRAVSSA
jgi:FlaA1/EpsC-like NDP-sugar epimerase